MTMTLEIDLERIAEPLLFPGFTWQQFKAVEPLLDVPGVRLSFLDGVLEIRRMPGKKHEVVKKRIGILVEAYLEIAGIPHTPTGSMTLESESGLVRREADESYEIGTDRDRPDLAIEVVVTRGGINKLEAYRRLQIPEVWFWEKEQFSFYALRVDRYEAIQQSELLSNLDRLLLTKALSEPNHLKAVQEFRRSVGEAIRPNL
ncbi:MAG: Uma2 family endonuclease [Leptolyngbyaceae cyanobacterium CSU_1_3]|nr:Uma2 family endonuclease [Leptolyngbyaceae cyanobacterium CSU_1_3]